MLTVIFSCACSCDERTSVAYARDRENCFICQKIITFLREDIKHLMNEISLNNLGVLCDRNYINMHIGESNKSN